MEFFLVRLVDFNPRPFGVRDTRSQPGSRSALSASFALPPDPATRLRGRAALTIYIRGAYAAKCW